MSADHTVCHLAAEGAALEILELEDHIRDLMALRDTYRDMALAALDRVRDLTAARARDRETIRELRERLRSLSPVDSDHERRAA